MYIAELVGFWNRDAESHGDCDGYTLYIMVMRKKLCSISTIYAHAVKIKSDQHAHLLLSQRSHFQLNLVETFYRIVKVQSQ